MKRIFVPTTGAGDWKRLLAEPDKQWKTGYSAKTLAHCWEEAKDFPACIQNVFEKSGIKLFQHIELLLALPEYKVPLPGGRRASQNDVFVLAKGDDQLISITVEGKVSEPFGETLSEWKQGASKGKITRLKFLLDKLELKENDDIKAIRYQLVHRTASAVVEAEKFKAKNALMLVHSFSRDNDWFEDYEAFLALFGLKDVIPDSLCHAGQVNAVDLYFGWVRGDKNFLVR